MHDTLPRSLLAAALLAATCGAQAARQELTIDVVTDQPWRITPPAHAMRWVPGTTRYSWSGSDRILARDARDLAEPVVVPLDRLARALRAAGAEQAPARIPTHRWLGRDTLRIEHGGAIFHWTVGEKAARVALRGIPDAARSAVHELDRIGAFVVDHDIFVARADGTRRRITWDGSADIVYGDAAHRAEFGIGDGLWWDGAGRRLAFYREDQRPIAPYPYADYTSMPPRPAHGRYPMAGRPHSRVTVGVYDAADDTVRFLEHDPAADVYWTNVAFSPDGGKVYVALVNRGQDHVELTRFDASTGAREKVLFVESDREWVEPEQGPIFVPDASGDFLWFSSRDGYRHLYRYRSDGRLVGQVTSGAFDVVEQLAFTADGERCFVMASGDNPLEMHLWSVKLQTGAMHQITSQPGCHACEMSPDRRLVLDTFSNSETPPTVAVLSVRRGRHLFSTRPVSQPASSFELPEQEFFTLEAADGTVLHGHLLLPPGVDRDRPGDKKYPVLHYVYGGPHSQLVRDRWLGGASPWLVYMATRGFVVCRLDNRGTDNRGIEFAQTVHRRLGTVEVEDQLAAIRWLREQPFVDRERIGVHGWSYGGYLTLSLMLRAPDLFACGISGAPVTDWAQYETGYTERYMDTPAENPDGYAAASAVARAGGLRGRLLLVHGTDDRTVMLSHSIAFLDACIDAGAMPECMLYPMQKHGLRGADRKHLQRMMTRWFERELQP